VYFDSDFKDNTRTFAKLYNAGSNSLIYIQRNTSNNLYISFINIEGTTDYFNMILVEGVAAPV
jgi:hypothetical protein